MIPIRGDDRPRLILASRSPYRASIMADAGLKFDLHAPAIDERAVEAPLLDSGMDGADIAIVLSIAKAEDVSMRHRGRYVIGADQTLTLDGELLHKPEDMEAARRRLLRLSGRVHRLNTAACILRDGETLWSHAEICTIRFRQLDPGFVGRHLAEVGEAALGSVGAYQIEGRGVQLFDSMEGDFFSIMGLPLLPLLGKLRQFDLIDH